jgi:hypothetical protein
LITAAFTISVFAESKASLPSGTEGTINWAYSENPEKSGTYILTITGTGAMPDASGAKTVVWRENASNYYTKTSKVVIGEGVTSIGQYAFNQFVELEEIVIPSTVTAIKKQGLTATAIKNLVIPETVTSVNAEAFSSNSYTSIAIPEALNPGSAASIFKSTSIGNVIIYSSDSSTQITSKIYNNITNTNVKSVGTVTVATANGSVTYNGTASVTSGATVSFTKTENSGKTSYTMTGPAPAGTTVTLPYQSGLDASEFAVIGVEGATYDEESGNVAFAINAAGTFDIIALPTIKNCALRINRDINMVYTVSVPAIFSDAVFTVEFMGETYTLEGTQNGEYTKYLFEQIMPQYMTETLTAKLCATYGGKTYEAEARTTSVREYCAHQIEINSADAELVALVSDILVYGAKAQAYANYKTDDLATDGVAIKPSEAYVPENKISHSGEAYDGAKLTAAGLICADGFKIYVQFTANDTEDLYLVATLNGREVRFDVSSLCANGGLYNVIIDDIGAHELDDELTLSFEKNGEQVGTTTVMTVNSYVSYMLNNAGAGTLTDLVSAIATYGNSAKIYYNKIGG